MKERTTRFDAPLERFGLLPLPPLAGQKSIVSKVAELFAVLDAMKGMTVYGVW